MTIAIVTPCVAAAIGLRHILQSYFDTEAEVFGNARSLLAARPERFDAYFVTPEACIAAIDLLMPRKAKVALLLDGNTAANNLFASIDISSTEEELIDAIDTCIEKIGKTVAPAPGELTPRETDVLRCIARGMINKEIADSLNISINTVLTHRKNITAKLGIKTVSGLSLYAMMNGLIEAR